MVIVSTGEFRANQKNYLDKIDEGQEVLIQRGKSKSYRILPVTEVDTIIPKDYILEPDEEFEKVLATGLSVDEFRNKALKYIKSLHKK